MKTEIVFGDRFVPVELSGKLYEAPASPTLPLPAVDDLREAVARALAAPLGLPPLRDLARGARRVTIAFDDPTVPCFAPVWEAGITGVLGELRAAGVPDSGVQLLCANALHRKFTHRELAGILGDALVAEHGDRLSCHDAEDPGNLVCLGRTPGGHDVELHRAVAESDLTVYVNTSSYRGFNGGWKSVCVGLSTWRSIRAHHTPERMTMSFDRNAMHEILDEMGALVEGKLGPSRIFKLETLLANPMQVARLWAGRVGETRRALLEVVRSTLPARRDTLREKADIVLYGVPDWSPYAAYSFMNPLLTLLSTGLGYLGGVVNALGRPGCSVILATPCPERWDDAHHPSYREVWDRILPASGRDPTVALRDFAADLCGRTDYLRRYREGFGFHPVHPLMGLFPLTRLRHAARVLVAGIEAPHLARHAGFEPTATVEEAVERARSFHGSDASIALVRYPPAFNRALPS
jgi:hypothetical protein